MAEYYYTELIPSSNTIQENELLYITFSNPNNVIAEGYINIRDQNQQLIEKRIYECSFQSDKISLTFDTAGVYNISYYAQPTQNVILQSSNTLTITVSQKNYNKKLIVKKSNDTLTLLDEQIIQSKLDEKLNVSDAFSGDYDDLNNKPSIPTKTSDLTNDSSFLTQHQDISGKVNRSELSTVATSGSYDDLTNKPSIPNIESVYEITSDKGTASENTMGKLYIEIQNNKRDVYYTSSDTTELGYFYFKKESGKLHVYGNFYDSEKYYYLLTDEYKIVDSFEYDSNESLWTISKDINDINGHFAIGISDTEIEVYDLAPTYINPDNCYTTDYYYSSYYVSDIEDNVSSQYIDIIKDNDYNWHKLDDDVLDSLSIRWTNIQNRPSIPSASSSTPSADVSGGAIGSSSNYAKADHQHPLSSAYATSGHNHSGTYAPVSHTQASTTITDMDVVQVVVTYTDNTTETLNLFKKVVSQ